MLLLTPACPRCLHSGPAFSFLSQTAVDAPTDNKNSPKRPRTGLQPERRIPSPGGFVGPPLPRCCKSALIPWLRMKSRKVALLICSQPLFSISLWCIEKRSIWKKKMNKKLYFKGHLHDWSKMLSSRILKKRPSGSILTPCNRIN